MSVSIIQYIFAGMEDKIIEMYLNKLSPKKIAKELKITLYKVIKVLKNNNIKLRNLSESHKIYKYNEDYFEKIDSERKAYFLGLMFADGNVCIKNNRKRLQITLANEDLYILKEFLKDLGGGSLYLDRVVYSKVLIYSDKLVDDLINLGCVPNKSLILKFPLDSIPNYLVNHFIRGFFDGDGSVSKVKEIGYTINFTSVQSFLNPLKESLIKDGIRLSKFYPRYKDRIDSAGSMYFYQSKKKEKVFFNYLYNNASIYMDRKYLKMKIYEHTCV